MPPDLLAAFCLEANANAPPACELGTIGWDDREEHFDIGTNDNDGYTLVFVQLYRGRDMSEPPLQFTRAEGHKILCMISSTIFRIPKKGTRCYVLFPHGMSEAPGAGVIVATVEKSPTIQFGATRAKLDFGDDVDLVIKARSVTVTDYENQQVSLGPEGGVQLFDKAGAGIQFKSGNAYSVSQKYNFVVQTDGAVKAALKMSDGEVALLEQSGNVMKMKNGQTTFGTGKFVADATLVMLGKGAVAGNFAAVYPLVGGVPAPATKVWISIL